MSSPEEQLQSKLAKLKDVFLAQLPEKIESLQSHWNALTEHGWSHDSINAFHLIVHSLIGTSGTFGFTEISNLARELEVLVKAISQQGTAPSKEDIEKTKQAFVTLCSEMLASPTENNIEIDTTPDASSEKEAHKVLIVDDDIVLANITADHLRLHGFFVETLAHPGTLQEVVKNFQPSIILMDMVFEEGTLAGAAAVEVLRDNNDSTPVIFISVNEDMSSRLNAIRTGAYSYLTKPLDLDLLLSTIITACNIKPDLPYRVLIVDDDEEILELHAEALRSDGMDVYPLSDPMQTLDVINEFNPELILLDMYMPECSGFEVAMTIRQNSNFDDIPIVFLSSEQDVSIRLMAIKLGSDDFITKPVNLDYLKRAIQARVEKARKLKETSEDYKNALAKITEKKKLAERANKTKSEFISKMSHELRTPLNSILGYTQLLEIDHDDTLSDQQKGNVQHILSSGWHLLALINDVLDISKIEIGHLSLANTSINFDKIIKDVVQMNSDFAKQQNVSISYKNKCDEDITVYADSTRLRQVLSNIISNAIKYNVDGGKVDITVTPENDSCIKVLISDTGRGLPEDKIESLFTPFNRLGLEDTSIEGNGIGLALSSQLIGLMSGDIGACNNEGPGASFWFTLNQYREPENIQLDINRITKVLYVEDSDLDFELVSKSLLAQDNIELFTARDAESALNIANKFIPDVILLDIELSSMDGTTMLSALRTRKHLKQVPIFALSSTDIPSDQQSIGEESFYCYFSKPYNISKLIDSISSLLEIEQPDTTTLV